MGTGVVECTPGDARNGEHELCTRLTTKGRTHCVLTGMTRALLQAARVDPELSSLGFGLVTWPFTQCCGDEGVTLPPEQSIVGQVA